MADLSKRIALLALAAAAGCRDSFPPIAGPLDRFYYPLGLAVRRLPAGNTALLVVSTNFDLRYDYDVGGAVVAVDPDASGDALAGDPTLAVLGGLNIGSFGGEIGYLDGSCAPLAASDPGVAAGGAKVVTASRGSQTIYALDMDAQGRLACDGCAVAARTEALDPYGVATVCAEMGGVTKAAAYVTHLRAPGNRGWVTDLDLRSLARVDIDMGFGSTYTSTALVTSDLLQPPPPGTPYQARLFVSTRLLTVDSVPLKWFDPLEVTGSGVAIASHDVATVVTGALTRKLAISSDGQRGYLMLDLFDYDQARTSGVFIPTGSALAVYDISESSFAQPLMRLLRLVPTGVGSGDIKVMRRAGQRDLVALTCDTEGSLLFYDDEVGAVVHRMALDPSTGAPQLGRQPFGLALEERGGAGQGPCLSRPGACTRLYVASFERSWVSLVELDPAEPALATVAKRIGRERD